MVPVGYDKLFNSHGGVGNVSHPLKLDVHLNSCRDDAHHRVNFVVHLSTVALHQNQPI